MLECVIHITLLVILNTERNVAVPRHAVVVSPRAAYSYVASSKDVTYIVAGALSSSCNSHSVYSLLCCYVYNIVRVRREVKRKNESFSKKISLLKIFFSREVGRGFEAIGGRDVYNLHKILYTTATSFFKNTPIQNHHPESISTTLEFFAQQIFLPCRTHLGNVCFTNLFRALYIVVALLLYKKLETSRLLNSSVAERCEYTLVRSTTQCLTQCYTVSNLVSKQSSICQ